MKKLVALALILMGCNSAQPHYEPPIQAEQNSCPMPNNVQWEVHFSPKGGTTSFIVENINKANESIYVQAYSFTSGPIAEALVYKKRQGKVVEVILDKSDLIGKGTQINTLTMGKVPVYIDDKHAIAHNKIIIIDRKTVFTGSFNFTNAAENSNAENSIKLTDDKLANIYLQNWENHREHSK